MIRQQYQSKGVHQVRTRSTEPAALILTVTDSQQNHINHALALIFTSITDSDTLLQTNTNPPMTCFLIHLARDFDTHGAFLSTLLALPPAATHIDKFASLSYASSWLQSSLTLIRDSCKSESGAVELQMPFVLLETEFQLARARAAALQQQYPEEGIVVATLDLRALRGEKLVLSAEHGFQMLRVPVQEVDVSRKLLVWVGNGGEEGVGRVLRDAVLAVMKWKEGRTGDGLRDVEKGGIHAGKSETDVKGVRSGNEPSGSTKQPREKYLGVTTSASLEEFSVWTPNSEDWSAFGGSARRRRGTCCF